MTDQYSLEIQAAERGLLLALNLLSDELRGYPTPISGCDAQFNHMIGERNRIRAALDALAAPVFVATPRTPSPNAGVESR